FVFFFLSLPRHPRSTLFPYTTLFRSSNGVHAAMVEVDRETGQVTVRRYAIAEDCGPLINPRIVDGQIHGGLAQGFGEALLEQVVYDAEGQPLTTTFMDYLLPTAKEMP